ncbi:MAG: BrnT family toxin [Rhizomicrobium sp.]
MEFSGFDWDDGNRSKCRKHGVSAAAIEALFAAGLTILPDDAHSQTEKRFRAIGRTGQGRAIFVVFTLRERDGGRLIRPISARYMHRKEVEHYEKACRP